MIKDTLNILAGLLGLFILTQLMGCATETPASYCKNANRKDLCIAAIKVNPEVQVMCKVKSVNGYMVCTHAQ